jgi:uncharacterized RDD family membrane protein YckC
MQTDDWASSSAIAPPTHYAGFWRRFAAIIIDGIILGIVGAVLGAALGRSLGSSLNTLIGWLYFALMESSERQATLGKMALGIYVTDVEGRRISFAKATLRYFAKILSTLILFIGFIMAAFTARKQALHDMIANTLVLSRS